jgi:REP element-mobilizing transposase RayT
MSSIDYFTSGRNIVYSCKRPVVWCPKYCGNVLVGQIAKRIEGILQQSSENQGKV